MVHLYTILGLIVLYGTIFLIKSNNIIVITILLILSFILTYCALHRLITILLL